MQFNGPSIQCVNNPNQQNSIPKSLDYDSVVRQCANNPNQPNSIRRKQLDVPNLQRFCSVLNNSLNYINSEDKQSIINTFACKLLQDYNEKNLNSLEILKIFNHLPKLAELTDKFPDTFINYNPQEKRYITPALRLSLMLDSDYFKTLFTQAPISAESNLHKRKIEEENSSNKKQKINHPSENLDQIESITIQNQNSGQSLYSINKTEFNLLITDVYLNSQLKTKEESLQIIQLKHKFLFDLRPSIQKLLRNIYHISDPKDNEAVSTKVHAFIQTLNPFNSNYTSEIDRYIQTHDNISLNYFSRDFLIKILSNISDVSYTKLLGLTRISKTFEFAINYMLLSDINHGTSINRIFDLKAIAQVNNMRDEISIPTSFRSARDEWEFQTRLKTKKAISVLNFWHATEIKNLNVSEAPSITLNLFIKTFPALEALTIRDSTLTDNIESFTSSNLIRLDLKGSHMQCNVFMNQQILKNLTVLNLKNSGLCYTSLKDLPKNLSLPNLKELILGNNNHLKEMACKHLSTWTFINLEKLCLSGIEFRFSRLILDNCNLKKLEELHLAKGYLTSHDLKYLSENRNLQNLKRINLSYNPSIKSVGLESFLMSEKFRLEALKLKTNCYPLSLSLEALKIASDKKIEILPHREERDISEPSNIADLDRHGYPQDFLSFLLNQ